MKKLMILFTILFLAYAVSAQTATNVVVDFDATSFDSSLSPGDSGIMNLVITNAGYYSASNVEVTIPSSGAISSDKKFFIGEMAASSIKNLPVVVRVKPTASTGLSAVNVKIDFDGYKNDGSTNNNLQTTWDVPLRIYGKPLFQLKPLKTTYFKDTLDTLTFEGTLRSSVKDLEATMNSDCVTVIGSSKQYLGTKSSTDKISIVYTVKPNNDGACMASIALSYTDESGNSASNNLTFGLNVEGAGVDFKIASVKYGEVNPGQRFDIKLDLTNVGGASAEDVTLTLDLNQPFVPVDTDEKYIGSVSAEQAVSATFSLSVGWDAEIKVYSIPLIITYKVGGTSYQANKTIGIDVSGNVLLEVINVEQRSGQVRVEVANLGTRTAEGVKGILKTSQRTPTINSTRTQPQTSSSVQELVDYKSDIKSTKQTTFTFDTSESGKMDFILEYSGPNNERISQTEAITVGVATATARTSRLGTTTETSTTTYLIYAVVLVILAYVAKKLIGKYRS